MPPVIAGLVARMVNIALRSRRSLEQRPCPPPAASAKLAVTADDTAAIQAAFSEGGELSAAVELRRRFPGITDNARARECARIIAGWTPPPVAPPKGAKVVPLSLPRRVGAPT